MTASRVSSGPNEKAVLSQDSTVLADSIALDDRTSLEDSFELNQCSRCSVLLSWFIALTKTY